MANNFLSLVVIVKIKEEGDSVNFFSKIGLGLISSFFSSTFVGVEVLFSICKVAKWNEPEKKDDFSTKYLEFSNLMKCRLSPTK